MGADKLFADCGGQPVVALTLRAAARSGAFQRLVIAAPAGRHDRLGDLAAAAGFADVVLTEGGARRQESVRQALAHAGAADIVAVHDGARPLCPPPLFSACVAGAERHGAVTAAIPVVDSIKRGAGGVIVESLPRGELFAIQTPQAFRTEILLAAHDNAAANAIEADDDAALVEALGLPVHIVAGTPDNLKVTLPHDLVLLRALLEERK